MTLVLAYLVNEIVEQGYDAVVLHTQQGNRTASGSKRGNSPTVREGSEHAGKDARAPSREHAFRHVPRMQFNPEPVDLDHWIGSAKLLRFS